MRKTTYPRLEVLQSLCELTASVSENRFISTRPNAVGEQMQDFLLIRLPQTIYDRGDTYQSTKGQIAVFARDVLEKMQTAVLDLFPLATDRYHAKEPLLLPGGADGAGFHSLIIQFNITIFKQP